MENGCLHVKKSHQSDWPNDLNGDKKLTKNLLPPIEPGDVYFTPEAWMVFTEAYHLKRGSCCGSGCHICPWRNKKTEGKAFETK